MNGGKIVDNFVINGGHELFGEVNISGAKNWVIAMTQYLELMANLKAETGLVLAE